MSLTEAENVFASVHEDAVNDFIRAFFGARPRHLRYGSPFFVPATTVSETTMARIAFPGTGGIEWSVRFTPPVVDLFDDDSGGAMPSQITLGPGQFTLRTRVTLCLLCGFIRRDDNEDRPNDDDRKDRGRKDRDDKPPEERDGKQPHEICTRLDVWALCHPVLRRVGGVDELSFRVDQVEIVDIKPSALESLIECLIEMLLAAVLSQMWLPLPALRAGAFELLLTRGPEVEDDQVKVYGNP